MRTLGIDLASQPKFTGACMIEWCGGRASAVLVSALLDDALLTQLAADADVVAVDAPLGWPSEFVAAVAAHHRGQPWPAADLLSLRYRLTDLTVASMTGVRPLSVSSDLIGVCAFRAARLGFSAVEVYPAGALRMWGLPATGYKGVRGAPVRAEIVQGLVRRCPWLTGDSVGLRRRDHDLDALLCALVARAVATGRTHLPPPDMEETTKREGWIHLPSCRLEDLVE